MSMGFKITEDRVKDILRHLRRAKAHADALQRALDNMKGERALAELFQDYKDVLRIEVSRIEDLVARTAKVLEAPPNDTEYIEEQKAEMARAALELSRKALRK